MFSSGRGLAWPLRCLLIFSLAGVACAQSDEVVTGQVLGPAWKQLSRRAGMIFAGTVLQAPSRASADADAGEINNASFPAPGSAKLTELRFRVDVAIAGVRAGDTLSLREWAGARSMHAPVKSGQHLLVFFYPVSRLGFTSPVGGWQGEIELDSSGVFVRQPERWLVGHSTASSERGGRGNDASLQRVTVGQLERAIRSARQE